ncbi:MAG: glycosyltransferase [Erythrobacteraceae bacterium]|jgi:glycosyltransferase involved in cell wall biosynthesis
MNNAIAMVVPSRWESFSLVFIEALFSGLPIIYLKGASVDGYFDGLPFAIAVDARNPQAIAEAMRYVVAQEAAIKGALARWQEEGGLARFSRPAIREVFDHGLQASIMSASPAQARVDIRPLCHRHAAISCASSLKHSIAAKA